MNTVKMSVQHEEQWEGMAPDAEEHSSMSPNNASSFSGREKDVTKDNNGTELREG
jgi:hypothetical protein